MKSTLGAERRIAFAKYFRAMLDEGIYLAPSQFEAMFVSTAHSEDDLERTVEANQKALLGITIS